MFEEMDCHKNGNKAKKLIISYIHKSIILLQLSRPSPYHTPRLSEFSKPLIMQVYSISRMRIALMANSSLSMI